MFKFYGNQRRTKSPSRVSKTLAFERLEDRRVLAGMADVVFLVDGSLSGGSSEMKDFLTDRIFAPPGTTNHSIVEALSTKGLTEREKGTGVI